MVELGKANHIILGLSAATSIQKAFGLSQSQTMVCLDIPSLGRQFQLRDFDSWNVARLAELRVIFGDDIVEANNKTWGASIFTNSELFNSSDPLIIWSDELLSTQLMIALVCKLFNAQGLDCSKISILSYGANNASDHPQALGSLTEKELSKRRPPCEKMSANDMQIYSEIWDLYCSEKPEDHLKLAREKTFLDHTQNATQCIVRRYPHKPTGLDAVQTELLGHGFSHAPNTARIIGDAMGLNDTADQVGDLYLFNQLLEMGDPALPSPLLNFEFLSDDFSMRHCNTQILPLAHDVFEGRQNYIDLNGIDRWIGGVHQTSGNLVFREDLFG